MDNDNVQIFYDGNGNAVAVQMPIGDYEKIIKAPKKLLKLKTQLLKLLRLFRALCNCASAAR